MPPEPSASPSNDGVGGRPPGLITLASEPAAHDASAIGMFHQIDVLSAPGAGLRHLDFTNHMQAMYTEFVPPTGVHSPEGIPMQAPSPQSPPQQLLVRTYGSEPEM